jgi:hypothetical protein
VLSDNEREINSADVHELNPMMTSPAMMFYTQVDRMASHKMKCASSSPTLVATLALVFNHSISLGEIEFNRSMTLLSMTLLMVLLSVASLAQ